MLRTSGFMDDVMFAHSGPFGAWLIGSILKVTDSPGGSTGGEVWCLRLLCYVQLFTVQLCDGQTNRCRQTRRSVTASIAFLQLYSR